MLSILADTKIFLSVAPTDMRKGFDGLQGLVLNVLEQDPLSGQLFLFINRRRDKLKILYWDGDGLAIWYRRLEQGTFQVPSPQKDQKAIEMRSPYRTRAKTSREVSSVPIQCRREGGAGA